MTPPAIRTTTAADADRATDTIVLAFAGDPMLRWCWSEPSRYLTAIRPFIRAFAGASFDHGSAWCSDDFVGAALWLPPGVGSDEDAMVGLLQATVPATQLDDVFGVVEQMGKYHPQEPHWYLPLIGVDPAFQNRGIGSALLALALARCDAEGLPAYLESSNPRNIPLYQRHGFEILGTIQAGSSPVMYPMLRTPR
ncbi:MAG TPA: GNAT family N-acetyltransferase [Vicinamibacterales bacterium]